MAQKQTIRKPDQRGGNIVKMEVFVQMHLFYSQNYFFGLK